ncbi:ferritin [Anaerophilus nitritogenes]|uniref:ferritin n=1 Tax=Anaerophilus nitritogenes TaxID=2498136 RepID=UPI00101CA11B|nr:ferritin [Anaerophilus nitritogenes]
MISEQLMKVLNDQMNYEFYSAHVYLAMAGFCASEDLDGFSNFFIVQAEEERFHAMKIFNYISEMGGRVNISSFEYPENEYESILDVFKKGLAHEKIVTQRIYDLTDLATKEKEHATISFLKWFIDEQVEEESTFGSLVKKLERISENSNALYMLDTELSQRTFTPPTTKE